MTSRETYLFSNENPCHRQGPVRKANSMGAFDVAEVLIGLLPKTTKNYCYPSNTTEQYAKGEFWS